MNERDSEKIAGMLENIGYNKTENLDDADIIFFNTCTVRKKAEQKVFGKVGSLKKLKEKNEDIIIGVGGCMMQIEETAEKLYQKLPHVDLILGTHNLHRLPVLVKKIARNRDRIIEIWDQQEGLIPDVPSRRSGDYKAWVSIIRGCNNFCSYCIVPYVRGREKSRPDEEIIQEIKELAGQGVKEVTLLGQNVNSYGHDLDQNINFSQLLKKIDKMTDLKRIRFMTSHPRDFSVDLIKTIKNSDSICEHLHLPLQAGSTPILKKMNRGYTAEQYRSIITSIRDEIPQAAITTDIIVGFPGEKEKHFQETLNLVQDIKFDMAFTFSYSRREGTPAADMKQQVPEDVKDRRLQELMKVQNEISLYKNQELVGKEVSVLVEGPSKNNPDKYSGRTRTRKQVIVPADENLAGKIVRAKIQKANSWTLYGELSSTQQDVYSSTG